MGLTSIHTEKSAQQTPVLGRNLCFCFSQAFCCLCYEYEVTFYDTRFYWNHHCYLNQLPDVHYFILGLIITYVGCLIVYSHRFSQEIASSCYFSVYLYSRQLISWIKKVTEQCNENTDFYCYFLKLSGFSIINLCPTPGELLLRSYLC